MKNNSISLRLQEIKYLNVQIVTLSTALKQIRKESSDQFIAVSILCDQIDLYKNEVRRLQSIQFKALVSGGPDESN